MALNKKKNDEMVKLLTGMGGKSPSGNIKWNQSEVAKCCGVNRSTVARLAKKLGITSPESKKEENSIDLARIDLMEHNKDRLLRELAGRDLELVKTQDLPKMVEQLAKAQSSRVDNVLKDQMTLATAEILKEISGKYKKKASNQIIDAEYKTIDQKENDNDEN